MIKYVYTVYDTETLLFSTPFFHKSVVEAVRDFVHAASVADSPIALYPDAFKLFEIATFDEESGLIDQYNQHKLVMNGNIAMARLQVRDDHEVSNVPPVQSRT